MMNEYSSINRKIKILELQKAELRTEILTFLKINDLNIYEDENYLCRLTIQRKKNFNKEKAIEFLTFKGENVDGYFSETEYEMLKIDKKEVKK